MKLEVEQPMSATEIQSPDVLRNVPLNLDPTPLEGDGYIRPAWRPCWQHRADKGELCGEACEGGFRSARSSQGAFIHGERLRNGLLGLFPTFSLVYLCPRGTTVVSVSPSSTTNSVHHKIIALQPNEPSPNRLGSRLLKARIKIRPCTEPLVHKLRRSGSPKEPNYTKKKHNTNIFPHCVSDQRKQSVGAIPPSELAKTS